MMAIPAWVWPVLICLLAGAMRLLAPGPLKRLPRFGLGGIIGHGRGPVKMLSRTSLGPGNAIVVLRLWDAEMAFLLSQQRDSCNLIATRAAEGTPVLNSSSRAKASPAWDGDPPTGWQIPAPLQASMQAPGASDVDRELPGGRFRQPDDCMRMPRTAQRTRPAAGTVGAAAGRAGRVRSSWPRDNPIRRPVTLRRDLPPGALDSIVSTRREGGDA